MTKSSVWMPGMTAVILASLFLGTPVIADHPPTDLEIPIRYVDIERGVVAKKANGRWDYILLDQNGDGRFDRVVSNTPQSNLFTDQAESRGMLVDMVVEEMISLFKVDIFFVYRIKSLEAAPRLPGD